MKPRTVYCAEQLLFNSSAQGDMALISGVSISSWLQRILFLALAEQLAPQTSPMKRQNWFRIWLGAVSKQAIAWDNVYLDLFRRVASLFFNEIRRAVAQISAASALQVTLKFL